MRVDQFHYWSAVASKEEMSLELIKKFSIVLDNYIKRAPIYTSINDLKDIIDCLLERCK
jgi:hypothetical protein